MDVLPGHLVDLAAKRYFFKRCQGAGLADVVTNACCPLLKRSEGALGMIGYHDGTR